MNVRLALFQISTDDTESISKRVDRVLKEISDIKNVDLVILPELWMQGAFAERNEAQIEFELHFVNKFLNEIPDLTRKIGACIHIGSILKRNSDRYFNTSITYDNLGKIISTYSKKKLFINERDFFSPGKNIVTFANQHGIKFCPLICFDLRFPELFRDSANFGSEVYIISAAWPTVRISHWHALLKARAIENQAFVVGCNGVGTQLGVDLGGNSAIYDPLGRNILFSKTAEIINYSTIDLSYVQEVRSKFPFLKS